MSKHYEQAYALQLQGDIPGCVVTLQKALLSDPLEAEAWNLRGAMLQKLGHPFDAVMNYDRAISANPQPQFYNNRGAAYFDLEMFDEALRDYAEAIRLKPDLGQSWSNIGNVYMQERKTLEAIKAYRQATVCAPEYVDGHLGLAFALLEDGQFEEGWQEFEWRWKSEQAAPRGLNIPEWDGRAGEPEDGLLLYAEQGHGDALQFIRYAKRAKEVWGGKIFVEVRQPLARLAWLCPGVDGVFVLGEKLPENIKFILPMMSAPRVLGHSFDPEKYLFRDDLRSMIWRKALGCLPAGLKVGVCWAGAARPDQPVANSVNKRRSTTLEAFAPLAMPGVSFVSLQIGPEAEQVKNPPRGMTILDVSEDITDFSDTASLVECLDLVITVDTAVAHLAGGMGKPVWLLSRYDNCWRWMNERRDSPWYPSLTQFRQPTSGDWDGMMNEVAGELQKLIQQREAA